MCCHAGRERGLNFNEGNSVNRNIAALVAAVALVGACSKNNEKSMADTMTKRGADTVSGGAVVPTTDTIVKKTTVTTDTIKGQASDSAKARADSIAKRDSAKAKATKTKAKSKTKNP